MIGTSERHVRAGRLLALVTLVLALSFNSVGTASATGSTFISGCCAPVGYFFYTNVRTITNPALPGPEVAFAQVSGGGDLFMGATNCGSGGTSFTFGGVWAQTPSTWETVGVSATPRSFCIGAGESSNPTAGFTGDLAWD